MREKHSAIITGLVVGIVSGIVLTACFHSEADGGLTRAQVEDIVSDMLAQGGYVQEEALQGLATTEDLDGVTERIGDEWFLVDSTATLSGGRSPQALDEHATRIGTKLSCDQRDSAAEICTGVSDAGYMFDKIAGASLMPLHLRVYYSETGCTGEIYASDDIGAEARQSGFVLRVHHNEDGTDVYRAVEPGSIADGQSVQSRRVNGSCESFVNTVSAIPTVPNDPTVTGVADGWDGDVILD